MHTAMSSTRLVVGWLVGAGGSGASDTLPSGVTCVKRIQVWMKEKSRIRDSTFRGW